MWHALAVQASHACFPPLAVTCRAMLAEPAAPAREFPVLGTAADPSSDLFRRNDAAHRALVADLRTRLARAALGGPESGPSTPPGPGQAAAPPAAGAPARPRFTVPGAVAPGRARDVRRRMPGGGAHHRHRPGGRPPLRDRRQRRHREGRHLLPDHRQEAPPGPGGGRRQPAAVHLPGRFGRGVPARPGRGLPRPRPFRAHLLQPGQPVGSRAWPRSRRCSDRARQAAPTSRP